MKRLIAATIALAGLAACEQSGLPTVAPKVVLKMIDVPVHYSGFGAQLSSTYSLSDDPAGAYIGWHADCNVDNILVSMIDSTTGKGARLAIGRDDIKASASFIRADESSQPYTFRSFEARVRPEAAAFKNLTPDQLTVANIAVGDCQSADQAKTVIGGQMIGRDGVTRLKTESALRLQAL